MLMRRYSTATIHRPLLVPVARARAGRAAAVVENRGRHPGVERPAAEPVRRPHRAGAALGAQMSCTASDSIR